MKAKSRQSGRCVWPIGQPTLYVLCFEKVILNEDNAVILK